MLKWILLSNFILLVFAATFAQQTDCCMHKVEVNLHDSILIEYRPFIPNSVVVFNATLQDTIPSNYYQIENDILIWKSKQSQEIFIQYKKLPPYITENTFLLDTNLIAQKENPENLIEYEIPKNQIENLSNDLNYQGSFSRGVNFGNNHDLVLNSGLNLQMQGLVGDDIKIKAAISDENIPLQPEGNTQNLKEFDKIFIQIEKDKNQLIAGDYDLSTQSHFLNYNKNLQGASFQNQFNTKNGIISNRASIAISKGEFNRQILNIFEGNQGPYKLIGNQKETFIIILANTEKVFLDGKLLIRGEAKDYIIDYNQGEIFFTPNIPINANSRIVVEFEYATQNYLKSLFAIDNKFKNDQWEIDFHLFSEQESKNTTGLAELSPSEKQQLADAGDAVGNQFFSGIQSKIDPLNPVFYLIKDTLINTVLFSNILVYNPSKNTENRNVKFTNVGFGNGSYIRSNDSANGTIFQWIAPDEMGNLQGNYAPIVKLLAPVKHQVYNLGATYNISKNSHISSEISMSNFDKNRFSKKDKNDNIGMAVFTKYQANSSFGKSKLWHLNSLISYEYSDKKYKAYSPFRNPEFNRNWNIKTVDSPLSSHFMSANFNLLKDSLGSISYGINSFSQIDYFKGIQQNGIITIQNKGWNLVGNGQWLQTSSPDETTQFIKPNLLLSKSFSKFNDWKIGVFLEQEKNKRIRNDSLSLESFFFNQSKWFIESKKSKRLSLGSHFLLRNDFAPKSQTFQKNIQSLEYKIFGQWKPKSFFRIEGSWLQRNVKIEHLDWTEQIPKKYQIGQVNLNYSPWKGAVQISSNYEIGGGQEAKIAYRYLEVKAGQGVYQWIDYNQDEIQQINEFEIAPYPDLAQFVRIILPTQEYIATNFLKFNQSFAFIPKAKWHNSKSKAVQLLNYFSTQSTFFIHRRSNNENNQIDWNPFEIRKNDSLLIADNQSIRNSLFFNRTSLKFNAELGFSNYQQKNTLVTGFESIFLSETFLKIQGRLVENWNLYLDVSKGSKNQISENFIQKNYDLDILKSNLKIVNQWKEKWSNSFEIEYTLKDNIPSTEPNNITQKAAKINIQYNQSDNLSIESTLNFTHVNYIGDLNSPVSFELLDGLQNGNNFIWGLQIHKKISKYVFVNIGYNGRKSGSSKIIHLGNLQMIAQF